MTPGEWIQHRRRDIEQWLVDATEPVNPQVPDTMEQAMRYSLTAGGKRLRPLLVLASGLIWDIPPARLRPAALAVEYLHTYSLIHDDLPAMDNDDWRRGRPTSHKVFGEAVAILAGDACLTQAFSFFPELTHLGFDAQHVLHAVQGIALAAGSQGLIAGQVADLAAVNQRLPLETVTATHLRKTARLIQACCQIPAWLVGDPAAGAALGEFGESFGLAFQIVDDILDVVGDARVMGKAQGSDAATGKWTIPAIVGMERANAMVQQYRLRATDALAVLSAPAELFMLLEMAVDRQR